MVCNHCADAVRRALSDIGYNVTDVELGYAVIEEDADDNDLGQISRALERVGFELITDPARDIVESVKREIIFMVRHADENRLKLSEYLSRKIGRDYTTLSRLFSAYEGRTIESYMIMQKIERVKELLIDGQLNVSEIADSTGYSSAAHLSRQFKTITGMTPSEFRENGKRIPLCEV